MDVTGRVGNDGSGRRQRLIAVEPVSSIIFDNDGVLVDSEPHAHPVLVKVLRECGFVLTTEESTETFLGTSIGYVREAVEQVTRRPLPADFEDRYHRALFRRFSLGLEPVAGVQELIRHLRVPYCVASSGSTERIRYSLQITGLLGHFQGRMYSADDVGHPKPAPDLFLQAAAAQGIEPARCLVVEDSPLGIEAAAAAGMQSVGFAARTPVARLSSATLGVFESMSELEAMLLRLNLSSLS